MKSADWTFNCHTDKRTLHDLLPRGRNFLKSPGHRVLKSLPTPFCMAVMGKLQQFYDDEDDFAHLTMDTFFSGSERCLSGQIFLRGLQSIPRMQCLTRYMTQVSVSLVSRMRNTHSNILSLTERQQFDKPPIYAVLERTSSFHEEFSAILGGPITPKVDFSAKTSAALSRRGVHDGR
jgi:hypothetical protein